MNQRNVHDNCRLWTVGQIKPQTRRGKTCVRPSPVAKPTRRHLPDLSVFRASLNRSGGKETTITDLRSTERK